MNVLAYDLYPDYNFAREHQVVYCTLDELYHSSDIISLHCPLTEQTKYLINDYSISKMKRRSDDYQYGAWAVDSHQCLDRGTED